MLKRAYFFVSYHIYTVPYQLSAEGLSPRSIYNPHVRPNLSFLSFFGTPHFRHFFGDNTPMKYRINTKTNSQRKVISSRLQKMLFCRQNFYKQHQAMGWFEIIKISGIKRSQKKKKNNWKICRVQEYYCYKIHILLMKSNASSIL